VNPVAILLPALANLGSGAARFPKWVEEDRALIAEPECATINSAIPSAPLACDWLLAWPSEERLVKLALTDSAAWVAAYVAWSSEESGVCLTVRSENDESIARGGGDMATGRIIISSCSGRIAPEFTAIPAASVAISIPGDQWNEINRLAAQTFVPASDVSRQKGAGFEEASLRERMVANDDWAAFDD